MKKFVVVLLALAFATLATVAESAGTGMPMMKGLNTPSDLAALVDKAFQRDTTGHSLLDAARCKKDGSCATAYDYFHGIQLAHPSAKLDNIAELPRYLRSLVRQPAPAGEWYMSRILVRGDTRTYDHLGWHRSFFKGEDAWSDVNTGEYILAGFCENIVEAQKSPVAEKETPVKVREGPVPSFFMPPTLVIAGGCPDTYRLKVYVYVEEAMDLPGVAQTHAQEELMATRKFSDVEHVSRKHYTQFQKALAAKTLRHSQNSHVFRVSLIMTPESDGGSPTITDEKLVGDVEVKGDFVAIPFALALLKQWDAIRLVPIKDGNISSPPRYAETGLHEMRFFNKLPRTQFGEWDSNPDPDCTMGEAWIEKIGNKK